MEKVLIELSSLDKTNELAEVLMHSISFGRFYLSGELGSGKTTFVQFCMKAAGYTGKVTSPTFNLIKMYSLDGKTYYHIDAYRLSQAESVFDFEEALFSEDVFCFVEWPEMIERFLDKNAIFIKFSVINNIHYCEISSPSPGYEPILQTLRRSFPCIH